MQVLMRPWGAMHVRVEGAGPLVLFANSLGTDLRLWDGVPPLLPRGLRAPLLSNTAARLGGPESWQARIAAVEAGGIAAVADAVLDHCFDPRSATAPPAPPGARCWSARRRRATSPPAARWRRPTSPPPPPRSACPRW